MLLNCKLAEELGVENESQLKSRIEADTEALRRMDQKLIQLFEMFYLLENNSTVPSSDNKTRETQLSGTETQVSYTVIPAQRTLCHCKYYYKRMMCHRSKYKYCSDH